MVINSVKCRLPFPQPEMRNKKMCDACTTRNETKQSKEMRKNTKKALEECKKGNKGRRGLLSGYTFLQIKHRNMQTNLPSYNSEQKKIIVACVKQ
ncbi:Hypothetical protein, putative [Bodo saltans]|uniref:Uncharacterized protein n=1 Tax=Bodo saltans TaxID=75058 RepID=A0A0S4JLP8_BODSA|nr:Hypothetical protein, putative [Bodo saltans]|eukprot:CUG91114.1 Hypothetical protein, putative [Bodo saltans]